MKAINALNILKQRVEKGALGVVALVSSEHATESMLILSAWDRVMVDFGGNAEIEFVGDGGRREEVEAWEDLWALAEFDFDDVWDTAGVSSIPHRVAMDVFTQLQQSRLIFPGRGR